MFSIIAPTADSPALMQVKGDLTIYEVQQAHEQLMGLLPLDAPAWQLDLSGVLELDSAGVQLLLALHQALSSAERPATVLAASPSVLELAGVLALDALYPVALAED
ncbi:hypothetical protein ASF84_07440 [Pseudomonas sp. Leaf127]|uniref:STAS domain-containing protein n=1 Tax=Pseudomonas sp. Leaf127 TaxID=1736267 RepID=UPI0007027AA3|nr:STAS domain-containing protein [Pseudomonas sp. Leaf127]KQQ56987.1 hypothetical protein ASF84_07440 [Pseudomonas sp. Leaf127]